MSNRVRSWRANPGLVPWLPWAFATALICASPSLLMLRFYRQPAFDLGIYDQSIWLLSRGDWFNTVTGTHVFAAHLSPVLFALVPLAWIPGGAAPELLFQALVVASGAYPVWRLATLANRSPTPYLLIYAMHPGVYAGTWSGFRPWNLAAPLLVWVALWLWQRPTWATMIGAGLVGLTVREDVAIWVAILGAVMVLCGRMQWRPWLVAATVLAVPTVIVLRVVLPDLSPTPDYIFADAFGLEPTATDLWPGLAGTAARILYLLLPLGLGLAPLRNPMVLPLTLPLVGLALLGGNALIPGFHYEMPFVAVLIVGMIGGRGFAVPPMRLVAIGAVMAAVALGPFRPFGPGAAENPLRIDLADAAELDGVMTRLEGLVDSDTSISAPTQLVPHLTERPRIFMFPYPFDDVSAPLPMDCPPPEVVVSDPAYLDGAKTWIETRDRYTIEFREDRYTIHVLSDAMMAQGSCGPAGG